MLPQLYNNEALLLRVSNWPLKDVYFITVLTDLINLFPREWLEKNVLSRKNAIKLKIVFY